MSVLSDLGSQILGINATQVQQSVDAAQQQLTLAFETLIAENAIVIFELAIIIVLLWKVRK